MTIMPKRPPMPKACRLIFENTLMKNAKHIAKVEPTMKMVNALGMEELL